MDWDIARRAYFDALTKGTSAERDQNLAKTFQALGQVVHLVQDLAVPAHVRDDFASHGNTLSRASPRPYGGGPTTSSGTSGEIRASLQAANRSILFPSWTNP